MKGIITVILLTLSVVSFIPRGHAFSTLIYDNFVGSTINSSTWSWQQQNIRSGGQSQSNCCPTLYDESPSLWIGMPRFTGCSSPGPQNCFQSPYYWDGLIANKTLVPAIQSTSNNTLISMAVSAKLMNSTLNGLGNGNSTTICGIGQCTADIFIGFANHWTCVGCVNAPPGGPFITFEMVAQTKSSIFGTPNSVVYTADLDGLTVPATNTKITIDGLGTMDPTQPHVFQLSINIAGKNSWAAFMVDQMGVFNVTERSCSCIVGTGIPVNLYPVISLQGTETPFMPYSIGMQIAYVMVTDYIATNAQLPRGIYPGPTCSTNPTPGSTLNPLGFCTIQRINGVPAGSFAPGITADQFFQSQAVILGAGNVYFGGMFLTSLWLIAALLICITITRNRFALTFVTLFILSFFTIVAIIPWYVMFMAGGITMAVIFGVIPAGLGGKSGGRNG